LSGLLYVPRRAVDIAKQSGLGDAFFVGGYDLSNDTASLDEIGGGPALIDVTGIDKSAYERIGGLRDGRIEWTSHFNDATDKQHLALRGLPTTDRHIMYFRGTTLGNPVAALVGKQLNYDWTRADDGKITAKIRAEANGYGLEWGQSLTAGKRTDSTGTNGTSIDTTASASFGAQAYLQVFSLTGTNVIVTIEDSADNVSFAAVTGLTFTSVTAAPASERLATSNTATIRRYIRATTSGTFSSATFAVMINKNEIAGQVF
jgi:hypothetical protein